MESDDGTGYLLNKFSMPIMLVIFALTAVGITTCTVEKNRVAKWQRELSWQPSEDTYIYPLKAGELTPVINVRGECYRFRTDPHINKVTTLTFNRTGNYVPISPGCDTNNCPLRRFKVEKSGYLFIERAHGSQQKTCQKYSGLFAGWEANELPQDRVTQEKYRKAVKQNVKRARKESTNARRRERLKQIAAENARQQAANARRVKNEAHDKAAREKWRVRTQRRRPIRNQRTVDNSKNRRQQPGRWLKCKGTDYWRERQRCPWGQKTFVPANGSRPIRQSAPALYKPPRGWKIDDGNCTKNIRYVSEINGYICRL